MNFGLELEDLREEVLNFLGQTTESSQSGPSKVVPAVKEIDLSELPVETQTAVRELDAEIKKLNEDKEKAVSESDFETAAMLRDRADRLKKKRQTLIASAQLKNKDIRRQDSP